MSTSGLRRCLQPALSPWITVEVRFEVRALLVNIPGYKLHPKVCIELNEFSSSPSIPPVFSSHFSTSQHSSFHPQLGLLPHRAEASQKTVGVASGSAVSGPYVQVAEGGQKNKRHRTKPVWKKTRLVDETRLKSSTNWVDEPP